MTNVQLDNDVLDRLRSEKISNRDTYNEVLRRMFKIVDTKERIQLIGKEDVR